MVRSITEPEGASLTRRREILQAAVVVCADRGIEEVAVRDIAERHDVTR